MFQVPELSGTSNHHSNHQLRFPPYKIIDGFLKLDCIFQTTMLFLKLSLYLTIPYPFPFPPSHQHQISTVTENIWCFTTPVSFYSWERILTKCRRGRFDPWVGKILWWRKWQSIPLFFPGQSRGQRSLVDYSPWGHERVGHNLVTKQQEQTCLLHAEEAAKPFVQTFTKFLFSLLSGSNAGDPEVDTQALEDGGIIQWKSLDTCMFIWSPYSG